MRRRLELGASLLAPPAVALLIVPFRDHLANAAAALVLVAVVVGVASAGYRSAGLIATVSAAVWFDFFLTKPYERLAISQSTDIETTIALLVVGVAVTEIAVRSRQRYQMASEEGGYLAVIRDASDLVATGASASAVTEAACEALCEVLSLRSCRFEATLTPTTRPRLERTGEVELGTTRFAVDAAGLPAEEIELLVQQRGRTVGRFVMDPLPGKPLSIEKRITAIALADQTGAAYEAQSKIA
ncbi:MAG: DUF4118 domain-containing protein [Acidimicrobiales bacterium]|jgi:hypothetical protein